MWGYCQALFVPDVVKTNLPQRFASSSLCREGRAGVISWVGFHKSLWGCDTAHPCSLLLHNLSLVCVLKWNISSVSMSMVYPPFWLPSAYWNSQSLLLLPTTSHYFHHDCNKWFSPSVSLTYSMALVLYHSSGACFESFNCCNAV